MKNSSAVTVAPCLVSESCPAAEQLRGLIHGELDGDEQQRLTAHLDTCLACRDALENIAGSAPVAPLPPGPDSLDASGVWRIVEQLKDQSPLTAQGTGPNDGGEPVSLGFLSPADDPALLGRLGRYAVQEEIGRGASGIVLKAFDDRLARVVALKVLSPRLATNEHARRRFVREARAAAAIRDDHVIGIHHVEEVEGLPFLVMEFIVGRSLQQRLDADGPLPLADILRIGSQIARGLAAAHAQGLVHRDIKPANILLENGVERVKITDFGLAHAVDDVRTTQPGVVMGTPEYMSPEQARGERIDHRSDLFSLGCVLYAICAGRPPFRAESTVAIIRRVCDDTPRPLVEINPEIPEWLVNLIDKLIAKEASERFQSPGEIAELLGQYLAHVQQPAVNPQPAAITKPRSLRRRMNDNRRRWSLAAAAVLLLCTGLALAESTGVTNVTATVIRIVRGDGTLVVEVDDPNIQVLVDGEEVVISGAGPKEIRLRPGQHELQSVKDGKAVDTKLVTITRDGREVVKVARERAASAQASPTTRLVWAEAADTIGDVSPDGRYLVFVDRDTGDLATRELATGKNRLLTNRKSSRNPTEFAIGYPKFSADGRFVAYTWFNAERQEELRVIDVGGGEPRVVYSNKIGISPVACGWTPDGKEIFTELYGRGPEATTPTLQLALVRTADGSHRIVKSLESRVNSAGWSALAPDGRTLAYTRIAQQGWPNRDLFLIDVETGQETQITNQVADMRILGWTPDGQRLLHDMHRQGGRDAWLIPIVGGQANGEAQLAKQDIGAAYPLRFTRDGTFYYCSSSRGPSLFTATMDFEKGAATATPLAAEKFNITDQFGLGDWSPDGEHLAYWARRSPEMHEIRVVSSRTGQLRVLKPELNYLSPRFRWSPDGRSFVGFAVQPKRAVYQIDVASGQATAVVEAGQAQPVWSRDGRGIFYDKRVPGKLSIVYRDLHTQAERDVLPQGSAVSELQAAFALEPSPDGRELALLGAPNRTSMALWLFPIERGVPRELLIVKGPRPWVRDAGWSRDGRFVLFTQQGGEEAQRGLWYISAGGGSPRRVAVTGMESKSAMRFAVHPDGKQLALSVSGTGKSEVWALENFLPPLADANLAASPVTSAAENQVTKSAAAAAAAVEQPASREPTTRRVWAAAGNNDGSISPDGRRFAFIDWETSGLLTVRDLVKGTDRRLTANGPYSPSAETADSPVFSPDGNRLAYTWYKGDAPGKWKYELREIHSDGGEPKSLYRSTEAYPQPFGWSPDGGSILVGLYVKAELQLAFLRASDGSLRVVKSLDGRRGKVGHIGLSPDGRTIAYSRVDEPESTSRSLYLLDVESGDETRAPTDAVNMDILAWTPDGRRLLFAIERQGTKDAWMIEVSGGKPLGKPTLVKSDMGNVSPLGIDNNRTLYYGVAFARPSAFTGALDLAQATVTAEPLPGESFSVMDLLTVVGWSRDGQHFAYRARTGARRFEIRVLSSGSRTARALPADFDNFPGFQWSSDGKSFITASRMKPGGRNGIYQIDAGTGVVATVVERGEAAVNGACWAPDGKGIFYVKERNGIAYREIQTGSEREIVAPRNPDFSALRFDVSPDSRQLAVLGVGKDTGDLLLRVIPIDGAAHRDLLPGGQKAGLGWVTWTPDGQSLLFTRYGRNEQLKGLWTISATGGEPRKLTVTGIDDRQVLNFAVHPDGNRLALTTSAFRRYEIWALENFLAPRDDPNAAGARSADTAPTATVVRERPAHSGPNNRLVWADAVDPEFAGAPSPDGKFVCYTDWSSGDVAVRELATGTSRRLSNQGYPEHARSSVFAPDSQRVAYGWRNKGGVHELRTIGLDGSEPRVLYPNTNKEVGYLELSSWSPDGQYLLASFFKRGVIQIVLVSTVDGSARVLKTVGKGSPGKMSLSPDGKYVAYSTYAEQNSSRRDILLLATDGSGEVPLVEHAADDYVLGWAPDGKRLLFASDRTGAVGIWSISVAEGKPRQTPVLLKAEMAQFHAVGLTQTGSLFYGVFSGAQNVYTAAIDLERGKLLAKPVVAIERTEGSNWAPAWSPDGRFLACEVCRRGRDSIFHIRSIETNEVRELAPNLRHFDSHSLHWSPDGQSLLGSGENAAWERGLLRIDANTGAVTTIGGSDSRVPVSYPLYPLPDSSGNALFYTRVGPLLRNDAHTICRRDVQSGDEQELYRTPSQVSWLTLSPDGQQLAFAEGSTLKLMPATGGEPREIVKGSRAKGYISTIAWTPDGRHLVFQTVIHESVELVSRPSLWRVSAAGGAAEQLDVDLPELEHLRIHPDGRQIAFTARLQPDKTELWALENFLPPLNDPIPMAADASSAPDK